MPGGSENFPMVPSVVVRVGVVRWRRTHCRAMLMASAVLMPLALVMTLSAAEEPSGEGSAGRDVTVERNSIRRSSGDENRDKKKTMRQARAVGCVQHGLELVAERMDERLGLGRPNAVDVSAETVCRRQRQPHVTICFAARAVAAPKAAEQGHCIVT